MPEETTLETPQPEAKEAAPPEAKVEGAKAPEPTVAELMAKLEAAESERQKLERDLKALRGARISQEERDARLEDIQVEVKRYGETQAALLRALTVPQIEDLPTEVKKVAEEDAQKRQKVAQERGMRSFAVTHNRLFAELKQVVTDDDGKPILDLEKAPELEEVRATWGRAFEDKDVAGLAEALREAHKVVRNMEKGRFKEAARKTAEETVSKTVKQKLDQAAVHDLDTGAGSGSSRNWTPENIDALHAQGKVSDEVYRAFLKERGIL